jgi:23S rRNA (adenine2503-C2)-methyltransferase
LEAAAAEYLAKKRRRLSIEWTMMAGVNDTSDQARKLARIALRLRAHVNLIALNPTPLTEEEASKDTVIKGFASTLEALGVNVTIRDTRGRDIDAACGQLRVFAGKRGLRG